MNREAAEAELKKEVYNSMMIDIDIKKAANEKVRATANTL
jgi:hypothetical protein